MLCFSSKKKLNTNILLLKFLKTFVFFKKRCKIRNIMCSRNVETVKKIEKNIVQNLFDSLNFRNLVDINNSTVQYSTVQYSTVQYSTVQ